MPLDYYAPGGRYAMRTWLQGSYKFATQIRPVRRGEEFDIDLGVYFEWEGSPEDGQHGAKTLKNFAQGSLQAYARQNANDVEEIAKPPKLRCCRIRYRNSFHIDVPAYHLEPERDDRCLATEEGWEDSDPKAIYVWFRDRFDDPTRSKVRRQVRYLKAWAALKFPDEKERPSSILLTMLVADAAKALNGSGISADDDALRDVLKMIVDRLEGDREVPNPVNKSENLARLSEASMDAFITQLQAFCDLADRATAKDTELEAADIWQEAFEHLFPMPDPKAAFTDFAKRLPVPLTMPEISVTATSRDNPMGGRFTGVNAIGPIPKNCDIRFEIVNAYSLPAASTIVWVVRNEGREAENINDLGHNAGAGLTAKEHSAYRGTHYMDCVVKVGGQTVAMRRVPVVVSGAEMPRRNPRSRPYWVKLRGRR